MANEIQMFVISVKIHFPALGNFNTTAKAPVLLCPLILTTPLWVAPTLLANRRVYANFKKFLQKLSFIKSNQIVFVVLPN